MRFYMPSNHKITDRSYDQSCVSIFYPAKWFSKDETNLNSSTANIELKWPVNEPYMQIGDIELSKVYHL